MFEKLKDCFYLAGLDEVLRLYDVGEFAEKFRRLQVGSKDWFIV
jgi:hypothetical protein